MALVPSQAFGLRYGELAGAEWSNGSLIADTSGNAARIYVYADNTTGNDTGKVNSIYMAAPGIFSEAHLEAGVVTNVLTWGKPQGESWVFGLIHYENGTTTDPFYVKRVWPGTWHQVTMRYYSQAEGATYPNTISVWVDNVRSLDFTRCSFTRGKVCWGTERNRLDAPLGGSFVNCQIIANGSWSDVGYGREVHCAALDDPGQEFNDESLLQYHWAKFE